MFTLRDKLGFARLWWRRLAIERAETGQGLVEYVLILLLIFLVVLFILTTYGSTLANMFSRVTSEIRAH